jgi:hypothetical protein
MIWYYRACGAYQDFNDRGLLLTRKLLNQEFLLVKLTWLTVMEYLCHKWPRICSTCHKYFPVLSSFTTYYGFVTRLTWWVPLVEHLSSPPVFIGVRVTRSLVLYVCFLDRCLSFWPLYCLFFFDIRILIDPLVSSNSSIGALKVSVIYKPIIKLRRFDWSEYNIVKGHMKV